MNADPTEDTTGPVTGHITTGPVTGPVTGPITSRAPAPPPDFHVFPVDWIPEDRIPENTDGHEGQDSSFRIVLFGKTLDGSSACVRIRFTPYFLVEAPAEWSEARVKLWSTELARAHEAVSGIPVRRKSAWGFTAASPRWYVQLAFRSHAALKRCKYALQRDKRRTYEATVEPLIRLFHLRDVSPAGWMRVARHWTPPDRISHADVEIETSFEHVGPSPETACPPLIVGSFDIESYSESGAFPLPTNPNDHVIQISTAFQRYGEPDPYLRSVVSLGSTNPVEGVEIIAVRTEPEVVNEWIDVLHREKVDVLIGWNTHQFDWKYIEGRATMCVDDETGDPTVRLDALGKLLKGGGEVVERDLNSSAYGDNKFFYLSTPGVLQIDLMQWFKKNRSLDSYSLQNVSKTFLNDAKLDLPASQIFAKFKGDAEDRADIARYAVRDTELPLQLLTKMAILQELFEMANAVRVPVDYLNNRGQQIRVYSAIVGKARQRGFVIPDDRGIPADEKFEGATVLDPKKGAYFEPIAALDFASLYPSIIRSENLSFDTLVLDKRYDNVPGVEYLDVEVPGLGSFRYAQPGADNAYRGILPELLDDLARFRKQAKRDMADAKKQGDEWSAALFDKKQAAYKVTMNSAYGFFGASKGFLPCVPIAASVTATGRRMISKTAKMAEELVPGSTVIYGDSVPGYTPVIFKDSSGDPGVMTIQGLAWGRAWHWCSDFNKQYCEVDAEVWSNEGWTKLHRIIRHRTHKPLIRVATPRGIVDVTPDHSLLLADGTPVKPGDVSIGDRLMHHRLPAFSAHQPRRYECDTQLVAMRLMLGISRPCTVTYFGNKYVVTPVDTTPGDEVVSIEAVTPTVLEPSDGYVYDLTTANNHFAAGAGELVVHNTDSVMVRFNLPDEDKLDMHKQFQVATRVADTISKTFKAPHELEMEKIYLPYILYAKKRYAAIKYESPDEEGKRDVKGLALVRRDNCPLLKDVLGECLDTILNRRDAQLALETARAHVLRVLRNEVEYDKYVISKTLRGSYKVDSQAHVYVARKICDRRGYPVPSGTRVPYIFVENKRDPKQKQAEKAEDPEYAKANGLVADRLYYIDHQLRKPLVSLFEPVVADPEAEIFRHPAVEPDIRTLTAEFDANVKVAKRVTKNAANNQREITTFFRTK